MKAEDILELFELIKNAPEENWEYNKSRLREIFCEYERTLNEALILDDNHINISVIIDKVMATMKIIHNTNSLDEILILPHVRELFKERLSTQLKEI
uniref:hypothetical protein n=1 Tax=uncultured Draconibacterium sp. TaxID=1573823 RepID=UPI0032172441